MGDRFVHRGLTASSVGTDMASEEDDTEEIRAHKFVDPVILSAIPGIYLMIDSEGRLGFFSDLCVLGLIIVSVG